MAKYRVTKGKSFTADNEPIPVGAIFEVDEVPSYLVGKVELVPDGLEASGEVVDLGASDEVEVDTDPAASIAPKAETKKADAPTETTKK